MRRALVAVLAICASAFVALAIAVAGHPPPFAVDRTAVTVVEGLQTPGPIAVMRVASVIGSTPGITVIVVVVGGLILAARRDPRSMTWLVVTALGSIPMYQSLKAILDRARPPGGLAPATGAAFPSGHATQGVAFFGMLASVALAVLPGRARWAGAATAAGLGLTSGASRVFLEVHWLTDVAGGFLLGGAWLAAVLLLRESLSRRGS